MAKYICSVCGYTHDEAQGDADAGIAAGTAWAKISDDYACPVCGADKAAFERLE
ncbi:MAG: rubredoxin [Clostridiales bacterium]|nr:rubredoxin [Clostridiales bacterium]